MSMVRFYERWAELDALFEKAVELPADEVDAYCRSVCGADDELHDLLQELVASAEGSDETVRQSISKAARDIVSVPLLTGGRVGAYLLEDLIGRGGMGDVYLASRADGAFDKKVAIKVVHSRRVADRLATQFRQERKVLASLRHPSIPALIDAGQLDDGRLYFISDYIDGIPISDYCDNHHLSTESRLALLERVGEALQHAHNNLVLHLDIKPENVLVQDDGTPCLLDFGIARLMSDKARDYRAFTPRYASPEQILGDRLTAASDVFSLGALMVRTLVGEPPFRTARFAPSETILAERKQFTQRNSALDKLTGLDPDIRAIALKALSENPADRYANVESFLRDIKRYRLGFPVSARPKTFTYWFGKYVRRHRLAIVVVAAIVAILVAFAMREFDLRQQAQQASTAAAMEAETSRRVSDFMIELFEISNPGETSGNTVTARELLDGGAARIKEELSDQPLIQTRLMRVMGAVYDQLGLYPEAESLLDDAVTLRDAALEEDDAELGRMLTELGINHLRQNKLDQAAEVLFRGFEIRQREFGEHHDAIAHSLTFIGVLHTLRGDYDDAEASLLRALSIYEELHGPEHPALAETVGNLANAYFRTGRIEESIELNKRAISLLEINKGPDHPAIAMRIDNLGSVYYGSGRFQEAAEHLQRALAIRENVLSPKHPLLASNLANLANVYSALGEYERSESMLLRALAIREEVLGPTHPHVISNLGNLGALYVNWDQLDKAEDFLLRSDRLRAEVYEPDHPRIATSKINLGLMYIKLGRLGEAEAALTAANAILESKVTDDHLYRITTDWKLATIYAETGRIDEARGLFEKVLPVWQARPDEDSDKADMLRDYEAFIRDHGRE